MGSRGKIFSRKKKEDEWQDQLGYEEVLSKRRNNKNVKNVLIVNI